MPIINRRLSDGRPTTAEWSVRIWDETEFPDFAKEPVLSWMKDSFTEYDFVYTPKRRTSEQSFCYFFGYGKEEIYYQKEGELPVVLNRSRMEKIVTTKELLDAKLLLYYTEDGREQLLTFSYVPSTYYLYDPFLNWLLGLEKAFDPIIAERNHPRPMKLYEESLPMYNYSLAAYRLGNGFSQYKYRNLVHRHKLFPWKKTLEEWLEISMERGEFQLHCKEYLTECVYLPQKF